MVKQRHAKTLVFCAPVRKRVYGVGGGDKEINAFHAKLTLHFQWGYFSQETRKDIEPVLPVDFKNYTPEGKFRDAVFISSELPKDEQNAILAAFREMESLLCTVYSRHAD